jgi:CHASE3 domain sensor protein
MKNFIQKNLIKIAIGVVFALILIGAGLSYYNRQVMQNALVLKEQSNFALKEVERVYEGIKLMDISSRGYALIREPAYLFWSVEQATKSKNEVFAHLDSIFAVQGFKEEKYYPEVKKGLNDYTDMYAQMVQHLRNKEDSAYIELLRKDIGRYFWEVFNPFAQTFNAFEKQINETAQKQYEQAVARNTAVQFLLIILGLPTLAFAVYSLSREERNRHTLLVNLEKNNKKYLFDDGIEQNEETKTILENSILNLQKASTFVNKISEGNYEAEWEGISDDLVSKNKNNLAGRLMFMRDEMKKVKEEDSKRIWTTEGLSNFSEIIRQHQANLEELTLKALSFLIKYTKSQQGSLFVLHDENGEDPHLKLAACYAFDRRKFIDKRVNIGDGLLGQAFLESETILLKQVPRGYVAITSGLGDAPPTCLIIVPLKHNEKVMALLELATFSQYEPYQIEFLEKAGEFIASAIGAAQTNEKNKIMMEQMRLQAEQMRAQEEELRQNLEELEATQEDMRRKQQAAVV